MAFSSPYGTKEISVPVYEGTVGGYKRYASAVPEE